MPKVSRNNKPNKKLGDNQDTASPPVKGAEHSQQLGDAPSLHSQPPAPADDGQPEQPAADTAGHGVDKPIQLDIEDAIAAAQATTATNLPAVTEQDVADLPALISRATQCLRDARSSAEVLVGKGLAEAALRFSKVQKSANETQAECLRLILAAEQRLADEVDAAQERGDLARQDRHPASVRTSDTAPATFEEIGIDRRRVAEWREVRDAGSQVVEDAIKGALDEDRAPTRADITKRVRAHNLQQTQPERAMKRAAKAAEKKNERPVQSAHETEEAAPTPIDLGNRSPEDFGLAAQACGLLRDFSEFARTTPPASVLGELLPDQQKDFLAHVGEVIEWCLDMEEEGYPEGLAPLRARLWP